MDLILAIVLITTAFILGCVITYILVKTALKSRSERIITDAENEAEMIKKDKILQAKEKFLQLKTEHEKLINEKNSRIS